MPESSRQPGKPPTSASGKSRYQDLEKDFAHQYDYHNYPSDPGDYGLLPPQSSSASSSGKIAFIIGGSLAGLIVALILGLLLIVKGLSHYLNHAQSATHNINITTFDTCQFSSEELTHIGLPDMPYKTEVEPSPPTASQADTVMAGCGYRSRDGKWELLILRLTRDGELDSFSWMGHMHGEGSNEYDRFTTNEVFIKGRKGYTQPGTVIHIGSYYGNNIGDTKCLVDIAPGMEYVLENHEGPNSANPEGLCTQIIRFVEEKIY